MKIMEDIIVPNEYRLDYTFTIGERINVLYYNGRRAHTWTSRYNLTQEVFDEIIRLHRIQVEIHNDKKKRR